MDVKFKRTLRLIIIKKNNIDIANQFIDAFYSFNEDSLKSALSYAEVSHPSILYYQKWAECANYKVVNRSICKEVNDSLVICPVTVKDDLMSALQIDLNVTDTFHIIIKEKKYNLLRHPQMTLTHTMKQKIG